MVFLSDRIQREEDCDSKKTLFSPRSESLSDRIQREEDCDRSSSHYCTCTVILSDRIQREEDCDCKLNDAVSFEFLFQTVSRGKRIATYHHLSFQVILSTFRPYPEGRGLRQILVSVILIVNFELSDRIQREEDCDHAFVNSS